MESGVKRQLKNFGAVSLTAILLSGCIAPPVILAGAAGAGATNVAGSSVPVDQQVDDLQIKADIFTILNNMQGLNGANVEVTVFNGIVLLLGQIPTTSLKSQLANQVSQIKGVVIVYNQLTVGPNISFGTFADDTWITSKVKGNMVGKVNPLHFKVVTQEGVVYILAQVTEDEGNQAAEVAAQTSGVTKVIKIFNYIAPVSSASPATVAASPQSSPTVSTPVSAPAPAPSISGGIPQYAPSYAMPVDEFVGPASSD